MNPETNATHSPSRHILLVNASEHVFGAEKSLAALALAMRSEGYRFTLVSPQGEVQLFFYSLGIPTQTLPLYRFLKRASLRGHLGQAWRWLKGNWLLYRLCRRLRPDLIHANGIQSMLYVIVSACLLRQPVVWHVRDLYRPGWLTTGCQYLAASILAPSEAAAQGLIRSAGKIRVIPNLIEIPCPRPVSIQNTNGSDTISALKVYPEDFKIGLVGQIIPRKGHDLLLDALPAILERIPQARIFFIGGDLFDPHSAYIQSLKARLATCVMLRERVVWMDYTSRIEDVYRQLDALVIPSRIEVFGRVALEAMAQGCPVIAAATGGLAELIQDCVNGLLFDPGDVAALARCMVPVAENHCLRQELVREGLKTAQVYRDRQPLITKNVTAIYERLTCRNVLTSKTNLFERSSP